MKNKLLLMYYKILAFFARRYLKKHKAYVIGINGSVGKTSCRMIIAQTLKQFTATLHQGLDHKIVYTSSKNFNGELGLSLSVFTIEKWDPTLLCFVNTFFSVLWQSFFGKKLYDVIILEYGIDRPKEMEFLLSIARPHIGVFTAIDAVHSEQFGDPSKIAHEEVKMIQGTLEVAFLNANDTYAMQLKEQIGIDTFTYQTEGHESKAHIRFANEKFVL
jgi:UDP-N-acetylmuramoyl-tripeptide--D-alanyl-D-alanine ligase